MCYACRTMNLKSVTFRCSSAQLARMESALLDTHLSTRTELIATALEDFMSFAEQKDIAQMDLFTLVQQVDKLCSTQPFREHA